LKLQNKKRKRLGQPRQALEGRPVKLFFDFIGQTEATRGARRWSWIKQIRLKLSTPEKFDNFLNNEKGDVDASSFFLGKMAIILVQRYR